MADGDPRLARGTLEQVHEMVTLPGNRQLASLGLGTWKMGESSSRRDSEIAAVRFALDTGWRVVDTAEMYGDGRAEEIVGVAVGDALRANTLSRDELFVVSKVYPQNATSHGTSKACERSLSRLGLDRIDLYLLHWRGSVPLQETVDALEDLQQRGRIGAWGVSNFDVDDMEELVRVPGGDRCVTDQIYFSLGSRGPGFALVPWLQAHGMMTMAYSPIDQGALARNPEIARGGGPAGRDADAGRVGLADGAGRRDGDPEGRGPGTPAGKFRCAGSRAERRRSRRHRCRISTSRARVSAGNALIKR